MKRFFILTLMFILGGILIGPSIPVNAGATCPKEGNFAKFEVSGGSYHFDEGDPSVGNVWGDPAGTSHWSINYDNGKICFKVGGQGGGELIRRNGTSGSWTNDTGHDVSHAVIYGWNDPKTPTPTLPPTTPPPTTPPPTTITPTLPPDTPTVTPTLPPDTPTITPTLPPDTPTVTPTLPPDTPTVTPTRPPKTRTPTPTIPVTTVTPTPECPTPTPTPTVPVCVEPTPTESVCPVCPTAVACCPSCEQTVIIQHGHFDPFFPIMGLFLAGALLLLVSGMFALWKLIRRR